MNSSTTCTCRSKDDIIPISIMAISLGFIINHLSSFYYSLQTSLQGTVDNHILNILYMLTYINFIIILSLAIRYYQKIKPGIHHPSSWINTWIIVLSVLNLMIELMFELFLYKSFPEEYEKIYLDRPVFFVSIIVLSSVEAYLNQRRPTSSSSVQSVLPPPNPSPIRVRSMVSMDMEKTGLPM